MDEIEAVARALAPEAFGKPFDECRVYAKEACRIFARTAIAALDEFRSGQDQAQAHEFLQRVNAAEGGTIEEKYRAFMRQQSEAGLAQERDRSD
jgi:hypothetical protein